MVKLVIKFKGRKALETNFNTLKEAKALEKLVKERGTKTHIIFRGKKIK